MGIEIVLAAIDLDDQTVPDTDEVDDEIIAGELAAEVNPRFLQERRWTHSFTSCGSFACEARVQFRWP